MGLQLVEEDDLPETEFRQQILAFKTINKSELYMLGHSEWP